MNRIPGFIADVSEDSSPHNYVAGTAMTFSYVNAVVGQRFRWGDGEGCNPNCVCLWPNGCPCCIGPGPGWPSRPSASLRR